MKEKRHYTNQERHKIYTAPKVKLKNVPIILPKTDEASKRNRMYLILRHLSRLKKPLYCKGMDMYISLRRKGVRETMSHASARYKSTVLALNLKKILENSVYICKLEPHSKNQESYKYIHLLITPVKQFGYAKITIGEYYDGDSKLSLYCITQISLKVLKK